MDRSLLRKMLDPPSGRFDLAIDTDAFNEADDQFALAWLLKERDRVDIKRIYAAPFLNEKVSSPREGMERSREEILRVLSLSGAMELSGSVVDGANRFMADEKTPVLSPAAEDLAELAMGYSPERPLYVLAIAAATDVASALLLRPEAADRMVVVWLGGSSHDSAEREEFNLIEDLPAAKALFDSGVPLVQVPGWGVAERFSLNRNELLRRLDPSDPLQGYLLATAFRELDAWPEYGDEKTLWDVAAAAWLLDSGGRYTDSRLIPAPAPMRRGYVFPEGRHTMRYVYRIHTAALAEDLFRKLSGDNPEIMNKKEG